jgi:hypothetical protein
MFANVMPLAQTQCEVACDVAVLPRNVENSPRHLFGSEHPVEQNYGTLCKAAKTASG